MRMVFLRKYEWTVAAVKVEFNSRTKISLPLLLLQIKQIDFKSASVISLPDGEMVFVSFTPIPSPRLTATTLFLTRKSEVMCDIGRLQQLQPSLPTTPCPFKST